MRVRVIIFFFPFTVQLSWGLQDKKSVSLQRARLPKQEVLEQMICSKSVSMFLLPLGCLEFTMCSCKGQLTRPHSGSVPLFSHRLMFFWVCLVLWDHDSDHHKSELWLRLSDRQNPLSQILDTAPLATRKTLTKTVFFQSLLLSRTYQGYLVVFSLQRNWI